MKKAGRPEGTWINALANLEYSDEYIDYPTLCELLGMKNRTIHAFIEKLGIEGEYYQTEDKAVRKRFRWKVLNEATLNHIELREGGKPQK